MAKIKVKANHQVAWNDRAYKAGDVFEIEDKDLHKLRADVVVVKKTTFRKPTTKVPKKVTKK